MKLLAADQPAAFGCQKDKMPITAPQENGRLRRGLATAIASGAFVVPLAISWSSAPAPNHPRILVWYKTLREPRFKPPDWAFPAVWTGVEAALFVNAYRLLRAAPSCARNRALAWWSWNVLMIGGWNRLFFKGHNLAISTIASASLVATSSALVIEAKKVDNTASRAAIPLLATVSFATVLTASIWALNRR